ncbi:MAG: hypothetical protein IH899_09705 [Planctomycetes bacterium]|nr:hypothetical protein [Planctomycetota bacterium]
MRHVRQCLVLSALAVLLTSSVGRPQSDVERKEQREKLLREMRTRAETTKVYSLAGNKRLQAKLVAQPIFRYSDQPRLILDATMWVWGTKGRPIAVCKVERYRRPNRNWLYCMASLSTGLIEIQWQSGRRWTAKKPGLELKPLLDAPTPAKTNVARLRQMKQLARRFSAVIYDPDRGTRGQMRLLPKPIHRYSAPETGLLDAAIFGLTIGTNPDLLLAIELHQQGAAAATFQYGLATMTANGIIVRLDDKQVWKSPNRNVEPTVYDTWLFFFESAAKNAN